MLIENYWYSVDSDFIESISYCSDSKVIGIRMTGEDYFYHFELLTEEEVSELFFAFYYSESKGRFYWEVFKGKNQITKKIND
jgi:hypothetical protein